MRSAGSSLRESIRPIGRTSVARRTATGVVPVRKVIAEENQLRWQLLISCVNARDQVRCRHGGPGRAAAIRLADAALQASVIGRPPTLPCRSPPAPPAARCWSLIRRRLPLTSEEIFRSPVLLKRRCGRRGQPCCPIKQTNPDTTWPR